MPLTLSVPPKYSKGAELTVWFKFSDGHKEPLAIGNVLSARVVGIHGKVIAQTTSLKRVLKAVEEFTEVARGRYQSKSGEIQYAIL